MISKKIKAKSQINLIFPDRLKDSCKIPKDSIKAVIVKYPNEITEVISKGP